MKGKEKLKFQQIFLEIFGLLKSKMCFYKYKMCKYIYIYIINIRRAFINTARCDEQRALYRIVLTQASDDLEAFL